MQPLPRRGSGPTSRACARSRSRRCSSTTPDSAWTPGGFVGVDVFFVISGFLITGLMVREVEQSGRLVLARFWARRARRLLPASAVVLVFSAVVSFLWLPVTNRKEFGGDIVASALYVVNWRLGLREVDYMAENVGTSPVQHYWSLAVEEQFYILWPVLIVALVAAFRCPMALGAAARARRPEAASFVYTLSFAIEQPGLAFFFSTTRIWELGVGALLAIASPTLVRVIPAAVRGALGWVGLAMVAYAVARARRPHRLARHRDAAAGAGDRGRDPRRRPRSGCRVGPATAARPRARWSGSARCRTPSTSGTGPSWWPRRRSGRRCRCDTVWSWCSRASSPPGCPSATWRTP